MQGLTSSFSWIFTLLLAGLTSCGIETAEPEQSEALVIASDFLHEKDTVLFSDFTRKNNVHLIIRHLSPDQMISEVESKGYNSGIDLVLSGNMHTQITLNKNGILQDLVELESEIKTQNQYISYKHNFVGIGLDPFVLKYASDSIQEPKSYHDLARFSGYHTLSKSDIISFLSPIRKRMNRAKTYDWAKNWTENSSLRPEKGPWNDSAKVVLCKYSQLETINDSIWEAYSDGHYFPNEEGTGVYFDLISISIVQQAEHYSDAQKFMAHCQNSGYNATLNRQIHCFPIYNYLQARIDGPKFYTSQIDQLLKYHDVLGRLLDKLN